MYQKIDSLIAEKLLMSPEIKPTISVKDAWIVAEAVMAKGYEVLVRNCNSPRCSGIRDGIAEYGDYFCNVILDNGVDQRATTHPVYAKTMPMAITLAVCKALDININSVGGKDNYKAYSNR